MSRNLSSRHRLNGYSAQRVAGLFLASSSRIVLDASAPKCMFPWRARYPLSQVPITPVPIKSKIRTSHRPFRSSPQAASQYVCPSKFLLLDCRAKARAKDMFFHRHRCSPPSRPHVRAARRCSGCAFGARRWTTRCWSAAIGTVSRCACA